MCLSSKPEGGQVFTRTRAGVETFNPAAHTEDVLKLNAVPSVGRDAAELKLNAVLKPAGAGMGELTPWVDGERETGLRMKWSPLRWSLVAMELKRIRKSSRW